MDLSDGLAMDREATLPLVEVAHSSRLMRQILDAAGPPKSGSRFELLDAMHPAEAASDWCRAYLSAALEHLSVWADFVAPLKFHEDQKVQHTMRPAQTLGRAALEASSQAVWVMAGRSPQECAWRHLRLIASDLDEQRKAAESEEHKLKLKEARGQLLAQYAAIPNGAELTSSPTYLEMVSAAASEVVTKGAIRDFPTDLKRVERAWRAAAGASHGKRWPAFELQLDLEVSVATADEVRVIRVPDPEAMANILRLADGVMSYGVLRYLDYLGRISEFDSLWAIAKADLWYKIPRIPVEAGP